MPAQRVNTLLESDGTVVMGHEGCRKRLAEYSEELYNISPPADRFTGGAKSTTVAQNPPVREEPPSYQEVEIVFFSISGLGSPCLV